MGCICSKATSSVQANDDKSSNNKIKDLTSSNASNLQLISAPRRPVDTVLLSANDFSFGNPISRGSSSLAFTNSLTGSSRATSKVSSQVTSGSLSRPPSKVNSGSLARPAENDQQVDTKTIVVERPSGNSQHQRRATVDLAVNGEGRNIRSMGRIVSIPYGSQGEQAAAGWPTWLTSVAGEAVHGWLPRRADSFEKIEKIGQGTYSSVYKARDLETGKIVAMKKVRFVNMDPESVRFMAREILILRKLDHPNVMKLEGLVTSRMSGSLYLVFEYMEHDLTGLLSITGNKFTEPQIKCFVQQLLRGLKHCHSQGILHRDIKGSNLLINDDGVLKIGDFGLATCFDPNQKQQLTSRVVTLWYRAPELLLGSTDYGVAVDMWSVGCIIAELYAVKPIMPGRTEVEQMHKIFKLCGSPSDEYWKETKLPHATSFKPQQRYKRLVAETFKDFPPPALNLIESLLAIEPEKRGTASAALQSEFFTTKPLPCDPSSIPKYPPSKELDIRLRDEDPRRQKGEDQKERRQQVTRDLRDTKPTTTQRYDADARKASLKSTGPSYDHQGNGNAAFTVDTRSLANGSSTMVHPSAAGLSWNNNRKTKEDEGHSNAVASSSRNITNFKAQTRRDDSSTVYLPKKNRIHYSGPLMPPGGNLEDMLKEHERQIQQAVRKSKARNAVHRDNGQSESLQYHGQNLW